ncbi:MAG: tRNA (guanosine(37)-N1)-methyltransferase TrmD [Burkholderiaceae bacterium]|nr:tRNA (guanosine(37)-N1)-methyltransferase TrmD [Burkholderiaceae bacterium]
MRFDVITLFPELFAPHLTQGITRRAFDSGQVDVRLWPLRDFAEDAYRRVDDRPYGGGPGMVMLAEPLQRALAAVRGDRGPAPVPVVHFSPTGAPLTQSLVRQMADGPGAVLLCGRYEGIDQRLIDSEVTLELSLGDFVLSGGELPALALLDAVARLQPGVLTAQSHEQDSFSGDGLLEGPHYSRPELLDTRQGPMAVPPVLLSGHHAQIERWRREQSLRLTALRRPDLIAAARSAGRLSAADEKILAALAQPSRL